MLISWKSKLQPITAGSTHEAELIALSFTTDEGLWIRRLVDELGFMLKRSRRSKVNTVHVQYPDKERDAEKFMNELPETMPPVPVFCDNLGTTKTVNNPTSSANSSRHVDRRYFAVRDRIKDALIKVLFVRTELNLADFFTKPMPNTAFKDFRKKLMGFQTGDDNI